MVVHAADIQDRDGAKLVLERVRHRFGRLRLIWADGGYAGKLVDWVRGLREGGRLRLEIVKRTDGAKGFVLLPHRWVVERTFAWLGRCRRLSKDYEALPETEEAMIKLAMIHLMVRRLTNKLLRVRKVMSARIGVPYTLGHERQRVARGTGTPSLIGRPARPGGIQHRGGG